MKRTESSSSAGGFTVSAGDGVVPMPTVAAVQQPVMTVPVGSIGRPLLDLGSASDKSASASPHNRSPHQSRSMSPTRALESASWPATALGTPGPTLTSPTAGVIGDSSKREQAAQAFNMEAVLAAFSADPARAH